MINNIGKQVHLQDLAQAVARNVITSRSHDKMKNIISPLPECL